MNMKTHANRLSHYAVAYPPTHLKSARSVSQRRHRGTVTGHVTVPPKTSSVAADVAGMLAMVAWMVTGLGGGIWGAYHLIEMLSQVSVFDLMRCIG